MLPAESGGRMPQTNDQGETFGDWLLAQKGREGAIAELIAAVKADKLFPDRAGPDQVRMHIAAMGGSGEWLALVDDAETDWLSY